jgi:hypothetical protein
MKRIALALALMITPVTEATADHPGERIDGVMAGREPAFEPTDLRRTPRLRGTGVDGATVRLADLDDRIVVLSFAPEGCGAPCSAQQGLLRKVQEGVNITPMRELVVFLTVGPATDAGWDTANWQPITAESGATEAAAVFAALSERAGDAPMIHVINRGGRHAAIFHGEDFARVNLILYINELTNAPPPARGWFDSILGAFH